ncbi:transposase [Sporosarcina sp. YIM B06819]|uniref:transposase n=1 Tax=Sporosarcina sp. YIM B06819 TaxID=3081769 RepID=UPI00298CDA56|nr:transposase [Sporosarcina sp. YIM B06819]
MELLEKHNYKVVARKFKVEDLLDFFVGATLEKWAGFRDGTEMMASIDLSPVNYSTVSKKAADVPYKFFKDFFHLFVSKCNRAKRRTKVMKQALLLVDSTTITVGKIRFPWAPYHGEKSVIKLHFAFSSETGMPIEVKETGELDHDEPAGESLANQAFILVEDRAYGKHAWLDQFKEQHQHFVIRLRDNVELHQPRSLRRIQEPNFNVLGDVKYQVDTQQSRTIHRYRVVTFSDNDGYTIRQNG